MIYGRFIHDNSWISDGIRFRELGTPSHVGYVITNPQGVALWEYGARLQGGVKHRPYNYCKPTWEEWWTYPGIEAAYDEALLFEDRKYDWKDILALVVNWHPSYYDPERAICSCLFGYADRLAWANGKVPLPLINENLPTWEMTPLVCYVPMREMVRKVL